MRQFLCSICSILILTSCVSRGYWSKEGAEQDEFAKIKYYCLQNSQQPESNKIFSNNYSSSGRTSSASNRESDALMQGFLSGFNKNETSMLTNDTLFSACMNASGFYWKKQ